MDGATLMMIFVYVFSICGTVLLYQHQQLKAKKETAADRLSVYKVRLEKDLTTLTEQLAATQKAVRRLAEAIAKSLNKADADKILNPEQK